MQELQKTEFECHPPGSPWWHWILTGFGAVVIFGAIITAFLFTIFELITDYSTSEYVKYVLLGVGCSLSFVLLFAFHHWEQKRWHWTLKENELVGGKNRDRRFPLSSIQHCVVGLPYKVAMITKISRYTHSHLYADLIADRKIALLLKFSDGSFMPFHVHRCSGGSELMTELLKRLGDRIRDDYVYTVEEEKALKIADWNRVVKSKSITS